MLFFKLIETICQYAYAYCKSVFSADLSDSKESEMDLERLGRFYWLNLFVGAFAFYDLFYKAQYLEGRFTIGQSCYPDKNLHPLAMFVFAELASIFLWLVAQVEAYLIGAWSKEADAKSLLGLIRDRASPGWEVHRVIWTWFPIALLIATYFTPASNFANATSYCSINLIWASIWPGLVLSLLGIAAVNWLFFKWPCKSRAIVSLVVAFAAYVVILGILGPADIFGFVGWCRTVPDLFAQLYQYLISLPGT